MKLLFCLLVCLLCLQCSATSFVQTALDESKYVFSPIFKERTLYEAQASRDTTQESTSIGLSCLDDDLFWDLEGFQAIEEPPTHSHLSQLNSYLESVYAPLDSDPSMPSEQVREMLISAAEELIRTDGQILSAWLVGHLQLALKADAFRIEEMYSMAEALIDAFRAPLPDGTDFIYQRLWWEKYIALVEHFSDFWDDPTHLTVLCDKAKQGSSQLGPWRELVISSTPLLKALMLAADGAAWDDTTVKESLDRLADLDSSLVHYVLEAILRYIDERPASVDSELVFRQYHQDDLGSQIVAHFARDPISYASLLVQFASSECWKTINFFVNHINYESFDHYAFLSELALKYSALGLEKSWGVLALVMERAPISSMALEWCISLTNAAEVLDSELIACMRSFASAVDSYEEYSVFAC